jgi:DNA polymerase III alpha subunit
VSIRIRTGFSFRTAAGQIPEVIEAMTDKGLKVGPITDRASTFGWVRWRKACKAANIKPVFGVELAVSPSPEAKRPVMDYWTFLATDDIRPLNDLLGLATSQFRYEPLLSYTQAINAKNVIKILGRRTDLAQLKEVAEHGFNLDTYVAASPSASPAYLKQAEAMGLQRIAAGDNFYPKENDEGFWQVLAGRNAGSQTYPQWIQSDAEWSAEMQERGSTPAQCKKALALRDKVLASCTADLPMGTLLSPTKNIATNVQGWR